MNNTAADFANHLEAKYQTAIALQKNLSALTAAEVQLRNFYMTRLKGTDSYEEGYCEGKRDAFLEILQYLTGNGDAQERIGELNAILAAQCQ